MKTPLLTRFLPLSTVFVTQAFSLACQDARDVQNVEPVHTTQQDLSVEECATATANSTLVGNRGVVFTHDTYDRCDDSFVVDITHSEATHAVVMMAAPPFPHLLTCSGWSTNAALYTRAPGEEWELSSEKGRSGVAGLCVLLWMPIFFDLPQEEGLEFRVAASGTDANGDTRQLFFVVMQQALATMGFESAAQWQSTVALTANTVRKTEGQQGLSVGGSGYRVVSSRPMPSPWVGLTDSISVDFFVPGGQPNPYWLGAVQMYASCPSAELNNAYLGQVELTGKPVNAFSTLTYTLPPAVVQVLSQPRNDCTVSIAVNTNATAEPPVLDNLRFSGGSCTTSTEQLVQNGGFETNLAGWVPSFGATLTRSTLQKKSGVASARVSNRDLGTWQGAVHDLMGLATPGATYQASAWVRLSAGSPQPALLTRRSKCVGQSPQYQTLASAAATSTGWVNLAGAMTVPNCTLAELSVYAEGPQKGVSFYVDDVSITRTIDSCGQ
jgi:hypothetical protein